MDKPACVTENGGAHRGGRKTCTELRRRDSKRRDDLMRMKWSVVPKSTSSCNKEENRTVPVRLSNIEATSTTKRAAQGTEDRLGWIGKWMG